MAFTLADAKNLSQNKLTNSVIDEFRKSPLMDTLVFDDAASAGGGQSLSYTYNRVTTLPTAATRAIGSEYTPQEAKTTPITVGLKVFGGKFGIDRVLQKYEHKVVDLIAFQLEQKIQATRALFADLFINGDSSSDSNAFDGLDKALTGSSTERVLTTPIDLSSAAKVKENYQAFLWELRQTLKLLDGAPSIMAVNSDMFAVFQSIGDYSTQFQLTRNDLGTEIVKYGNATIMNIGDKPGTSKPIIENTEKDGSDSNKLLVTDIYFARIGLDGVHGVTPDGSTGLSTYMPDMNAPGAVKQGEAEMVAAMALKATRAAAVLRGVQIGVKAGG